MKREYNKAWNVLIYFGIVLLVVTLDQLTKLWFLFGFDLFERGSVPVFAFLDLTAVWNRGISYGWLSDLDAFPQHYKAWMLGAFAGVVSVILLLQLTKPLRDLQACGFALVAGGALGNGIDRFLHGAVFDFLHFHVGTFSWYVFNVADVAVSAGVIGLVFDMIFGHKSE